MECWRPTVKYFTPDYLNQRKVNYSLYWHVSMYYIIRSPKKIYRREKDKKDQTRKHKFTLRHKSFQKHTLSLTPGRNFGNITCRWVSETFDIQIWALFGQLSSWVFEKKCFETWEWCNSLKHYQKVWNPNN